MQHQDIEFIDEDIYLEINIMNIGILRLQEIQLHFFGGD